MSPSSSWISRRVALALLFLLMAVMSGFVRAQEKTLDSLGLQGVASGRSSPQHNVDSAVYHPTKSPGKAMLLSAVLPGAGQFYNESYWKVPIVVGFGVYLVYNWFDNNKLYKGYRGQYQQALVNDPTGASPISETLLGNRDFYRDQRDSFTWYLLIWYFVTLADAYVDASLYDFNVGGDLSLQTLPVLSPVPVRAIQLNVHIGF